MKHYFGFDSTGLVAINRENKCSAQVSIEGGRCLVYARRTIKAGEEVTLCYSPASKTASGIVAKPDRAKFLLEEFGFECLCVACKHGWGPATMAKKMKTIKVRQNFNFFPLSVTITQYCTTLAFILTCSLSQHYFCRYILIAYS